MIESNLNYFAKKCEECIHNRRIDQLRKTSNYVVYKAANCKTYKTATANSLTCWKHILHSLVAHKPPADMENLKTQKTTNLNRVGAGKT